MTPISKILDIKNETFEHLCTVLMGDYQMLLDENNSNIQKKLYNKIKKYLGSYMEELLLQQIEEIEKAMPKELSVDETAWNGFPKASQEFARGCEAGKIMSVNLLLSEITTILNEMKV